MEKILFNSAAIDRPRLLMPILRKQYPPEQKSKDNTTMFMLTTRGPPPAPRPPCIVCTHKHACWCQTASPWAKPAYSRSKPTASILRWTGIWHSRFCFFVVTCTSQLNSHDPLNAHRPSRQVVVTGLSRSPTRYIAWGYLSRWGV